MKKRIGIVGGGQLGRMLVQAAARLGFHVTVLDPTPNSPAGQVADAQIVGDFKDEDPIRELASVSDFLTFEIESANAGVLEELADAGLPVNPSAKTLAVIKDKLGQKGFLAAAGVPVADFTGVESEEDIRQAASKFSYPLLLKARFDAYDGRGNAVIKKSADIAAALKKLSNRELYVEKFVPFTKELAIQAARTAGGTIYLFPLVETVQKNNICHIVKAPAGVMKSVEQKALALSTKVAVALRGAGVFGIELFLTQQGKVIVNEIAPRVHNSGHHTIESCTVSQFEQHVRLVTGLKPKKIKLRSPAVMINILGNRSGKAAPTDLKTITKEPDVFVHWYGKKETRPERKMGHLTALAKTGKHALQKARRAHTLTHI